MSQLSDGACSNDTDPYVRLRQEAISYPLSSAIGYQRHGWTTLRAGTQEVKR
jgi:hypothetical protein